MATTTQQNAYPSDWERALAQRTADYSASRTAQQYGASKGQRIPLSRAASLRRMRTQKNAQFTNKQLAAERGST